MTADIWRWRARLDYHRTRHSPIVDGDTIDLVVDTGFFTTHRIRLRLKNVDTAEIHCVRKDTEEYQRGEAHKQFVESWMPELNKRVGPQSRWPLIIHTERVAEKYGRWMGDIWREDDDTSLSEALQEKFDDIS